MSAARTIRWQAYLAAGVPVVLLTDDSGVSRIDLTNEYFRAVRELRPRLPDMIKGIARNALIHSFLTEHGQKTQELGAVRPIVCGIRTSDGQ